MKHAIILMECPDQKGIVARVSDYVFRHDANIIEAEQHSSDPQGGTFFLRLEFVYDSGRVAPDEFEGGFGKIAGQLGAHWKIFYLEKKMRMAILVSKEDHCLTDLLYRCRTGELAVEVPLVISNYPDHEQQVVQQGIKYHHVPVARESKAASEGQILSLVREGTDFLVLARYMQVLSGDFLKNYARDIINIHHSFLPSFKGANPYQQAHERGVKVIGATAHYVTSDLDEGPIIEQVVQPVSHRDDVPALRRHGRNLEKLALANAVSAHIEHRIITFKNRTIVFQ